MTGYHATPEVEGSLSDADPPERDYQATYKHIGPRFPTLGYYSVVDPIELHDPKQIVGDAIDDLADIVAWLWDNVGSSDAYREFRVGYGAHWDRYLHDLRSLLHAMLFEARD